MIAADRFQRLGAIVRSEIQDAAKERSLRLFGAVPEGTEDVGRKEALAMAQRNWSDQAYRLGLLNRVRGKNFRDTTIGVFGNDPAVWPEPPKED